MAFRLAAGLLWLGGCAAPPQPADLNEQTQEIGGENLAGTNLGGVNLGGSNLAGANLAGVNLGGTNLAATNLAGSNLAGSNLAGTNLGGANLAGTNLAGSNLGGINLAGVNLAGANLAGLNLAGSNLAGSNLAATNLAGANLAGTNLAGTNLGATNAGINIHALASAKGMLKSGEDVFTRASSCVVMGIGSIAFPRLVQANSTGNMNALIGKLPWTMTSGGVTLNAWEAIVWGPSKYCVFVMGVPADGTYAGVAGFIKALYRWSAPPTRSISIGQLGGGQTVVSHAGMMNAASKLLTGAITDQTFVAGQTAFVSATTNNESVKADFSSWVRGTNGSTIILGNVDPVATSTRYGEGSFGAIGRSGAVIINFRPAKAMTGVPAANDILADVGDEWDFGDGPKPIAKRCAGAAFLRENNEISIPAGKCDSYLRVEYMIPEYEVAGTPPTWSSQLGASAVKPYNDKMLLAHDVRLFADNVTYPVLSETYIFLNELPYRTR